MPVIIAAGDGRRLHPGPTRPMVKVGPHIESRLLGIMESDIPPAGGFPPHVHDNYEEAFYVLAGDIEYFTASGWRTASVGTTFFAAAGAVHGFRNVTNNTARHLAITSPATAMNMVEDLLSVKPDEWPEVMTRYRSRLEPPT